MLGKKYKNDGIPFLELNNLQIKMKKQIELKIKNGIYKFELKRCCIDNSNKFQPLSYKDRYGLYMPVGICSKCGLIQTNPRMTQKSYDEFYNLEYRKLYLGVEKAEKEYFQKRFKYGKSIFNFFKQNHTFTKPLEDIFIFEVGCGTGGILYYFMRKGCRVQGIDIDKDYLEFGKNKYGLDLKVGTIKDIKFEVLPDIVIYSHVLEHILNLKEEIAHLVKVLSENSFLFIEVPGVKNLKNTYNHNFLHYLQNAHTYHFTLSTLTNLFENRGFNLIYGTEEIRCIFKKSKQILEKKTLENIISE